VKKIIARIFIAILYTIFLVSFVAICPFALVKWIITGDPGLIPVMDWMASKIDYLQKL
jgi:hypothetical protein